MDTIKRAAHALGAHRITTRRAAGTCAWRPAARCSPSPTERWSSTRRASRPAHYLPPEDVRADLLSPSGTTSPCPFRGRGPHLSAPGVKDAFRVTRRRPRRTRRRRRHARPWPGAWRSSWTASRPEAQPGARGIVACRRVPRPAGLSRTACRRAPPRGRRARAGPSRAASAPPTPSSATSTVTWPLRAPHRDRGVRRLGVLGHVGEGLGDDEVRGALDGGGSRSWTLRLQRDRHGRAARAPAAPARGRGRSARRGGCRGPARAARPRLICSSSCARRAGAAARRRRRPACARCSGAARARPGATGRRRGGRARAAAARRRRPRRSRARRAQLLGLSRSSASRWETWLRRRPPRKANGVSHAAMNAAHQAASPAPALAAVTSRNREESRRRPA